MFKRHPTCTWRLQNILIVQMSERCSTYLIRLEDVPKTHVSGICAVCPSQRSIKSSLIPDRTQSRFPARMSEFPAAPSEENSARILEVEGCSASGERRWRARFRGWNKLWGLDIWRFYRPVGQFNSNTKFIAFDLHLTTRAYDRPTAVLASGSRPFLMPGRLKAQ